MIYQQRMKVRNRCRRAVVQSTHGLRPVGTVVVGVAAALALIRESEQDLVFVGSEFRIYI